MADGPGLFMTELDFYEGTNDRKWQPAPEDQNYLVEQAQATFEQTIQGLSTQLTKWRLRLAQAVNLNSAC